MAVAYKVLGQNIANATWATLYTAPALKSAVVSTIVVCNTSTGAKTFRIGVMPTAGTPSVSGSLAYDTTVPANDSVVLTMGIALDTGQVIRVYGSDGTVGFTAFGSEIS